MPPELMNHSAPRYSKCFADRERWKLRSNRRVSDCGRCRRHRSGGADYRGIAGRTRVSRQRVSLPGIETDGRHVNFLFKGKTYTVEELTPESFLGVDLVIASTPDEVDRDYLQASIGAG
jgi:hypothetical protein